LRESIEGLVWNAIAGPILPHRSKVVVEAPVLLDHKDDVIESADVLGSVKGCSYLLARTERHCAGGVVAAATSCPSGEK
jgi:hypothetical protein